jgi:hypothetical protein
VTVINSTISGNTAGHDGGGIGGDAVTVINSTISGNTAGHDGGGVDGEAVTVTSSTFSGNTATGSGDGGGLDGSTVNVTNSTFSGNTAGGIGGGIEGSITTIVYATLVQNSASSSGANVETTDFASFGSVVAEATGDGVNCGHTGATTPTGFNFSDDTSCGFTASSDHQGAGNNPQLGALGANGGPTNTMVPNPGSPLIDAIPDPGGGCPAAPTITTDQRGDPRPSGLGCDIGSVEVQVVAPTVVVATPSFTG